MSPMHIDAELMTSTKIYVSTVASRNISSPRVVVYIYMLFADVVFICTYNNIVGSNEKVNIQIAL